MGVKVDCLKRPIPCAEAISC